MHDLEFNNKINEYVLRSRKRKINRISKDLCHASETMMQRKKQRDFLTDLIESRKRGGEGKKGKKKNDEYRAE